MLAYGISIDGYLMVWTWEAVWSIPILCDSPTTLQGHVRYVQDDNCNLIGACAK